MFCNSDRWVAKLVGWCIALLVIDGIWTASKASDITVESRVLQAFQSIPSSDLKHEYAGAVIRHSDGSIVCTVPLKSIETSFRLHVPLQSGDKLVAIYHSHPGHEAESQVFSTDDIEIADKLHVDSYVLFTKSGELRVYRPHITATSTLNTERHELTAIGDKVQS